MKHEKISLCVITGNCEAYIKRFLDCFKNIADEIVVVRAIGSAEPDRTIEIAEAAGCKVSDYFNKPEHAEWPHVDNFAAARNLAFSLGSHEWRMWADIDDIISPESCLRLREIVDNAGVEVGLISIPYNIPEHGHIRLMKERLVRPGLSQWMNEVHECMMPIPGATVRGASDQKAEIVHLPDAKEDDKRAHSERNMRILESIPKEERTASHLFLLHKEHLGRREHAKAIEYGIQYLETPSSAPDERYEVLYAMGCLSEKLDMAAEYFHAAFKCDPSRREALAELSHIALRDHQYRKALAYAQTMSALPVPQPTPWCLRWPCYGALGVSILTRALRANGRHAEAKQIEDDHFDKNDGVISLIHATRGRPEMASAALKSWMERAKNPSRIEHLFVIDEDDTESLDLQRIFRCATVGRDVPGGGCVRAWNEGAKLARGKILIQMSDDWMPPMHWDEMILNRLNQQLKTDALKSLKNGELNPFDIIGNHDRKVPEVYSQVSAVLAVSDGSRTDDLLCMAIMTRGYYEKKGYMFHPDFTGVYSDNYFTDEAYRDGVVIEARDIVFEHLHPAFGKGEMDEGYLRQNSEEQYRIGKEIYDRLTAGN